MPDCQGGPCAPEQRPPRSLRPEMLALRRPTTWHRPQRQASEQKRSLWRSPADKDSWKFHLRYAQQPPGTTGAFPKAAHAGADCGATDDVRYCVHQTCPIIVL